MYIDGELDPIFYKNVYNFIKLGGLYYVRPVFYYNASKNDIPDNRPNIELLTSKLFQFGFILQQERFTLTFKETVMDDFIVFKKVEIPDIEEMVEYLKLRIKQHKVKYIYEKINNNEDTDSNDSDDGYDNINKIRRNVKQSNLDKYFGFLPNYLYCLLEYSYIKFDDTKVELI